MINLAGLGEAAVGDEAGGGDSAGVGPVLGVGAVLGVVATDGVASGEVVASWLGWVQPANTKTNPAAHAAGITPLLTRL